MAMARKQVLDSDTVPITARIGTEDIELIDEWRRSRPTIPSRSHFVRLAVVEKLAREGLRGEAEKQPAKVHANSAAR